MTDIDEILDDRMSSAGEYPDWWEPEDEGDRLQGLVVDKREDPWAEDGEDDPANILHIRQSDGTERSTRTHVVLQRLIRKFNVSPGDYVRIEFVGANRTDDGHMANDYKMGAVKKDELAELPDSELPENLQTSDGDVSESTATADGGAVADDSSPATGETSESGGDDGPSPAEAGQDLQDPGEFETSDESDEAESDEAESDDTAVPFDPTDLTVDELVERIQQIDDEDTIERIKIVESAGKDRSTAMEALDGRLSDLARSDSDFDEEVLSFAENIVEFSEGDDGTTVEELEQYLNTVRGFGVDTESVIDALGYEVESNGNIAPGDE